MALEFPKNFGNYVLKGMDEISSPAPVSSLPQGVGWWVLAGALVLVGGFALFRLRQNWTANAYRRRASTALAALAETSNQNWHVHLKSVPEILRAAALQAYPRRDVVALSGESWRAFLNAATDRPLWSEQTFQVLYALAYKPASGAAVSQQGAHDVLHVAQAWVNTHKSLPFVGQKRKAKAGGENV